ncbi:MAG: gliding motility-associated C-terminal domain-containing protein, partial [Flavobacterium sp.]
VGASDSTTFAGSHTITQDDMDSGLVYNLATVTALDPKENQVTDTSSDPTPCEVCPIDPQCPDCTITKLFQAPDISITKDGDWVDLNQDGITNVGDIISYSFVIKNTGNVTLYQVMVSDVNAEITGETIASLAVGATNSTSFSGSHIITQDDIDDGIFYNLATVTALDPKGNPVTATSSDPTPCDLCPTLFSCPTCTITPLTPSPALSVIKTTTTESFSVVGDIINYKITVINTGNQTLYQIAVKDPLTELDATIETLEPQGIVEYLQSYTVTQEDLDRGSVINIATANGFNPKEVPVSGTDDEIVNENPNSIDAVDDDAGTIASYHQTIPNFINVLSNDNLNGMPVNEENIILTTIESNPFMQLNPNGSLDILPNSPVGTQTLTYQICEKLNTTNCDTAVVSVTIGAPLTCSVVLDSAASCFEESNGMATATAIGGNGQNTYLWDNGETTQQAVILTVGLHTVTITDKLGYKTTCSVNVTINDTEPPTITCPENITQSTDQGSCTATVTYSVPLGRDNCTAQTTIQIAGLPSGAAFPEGTTTNIFEVTDASGTKTTCSFDVIVINNSKPIIESLPDLTTVYCPAEPQFAQAIATNICGKSVSLTYSDEVKNEDCPGNYSITRTWTATNSNGISSIATQTINVADNSAPKLAGVFQNIIEADCNEIPPIPKLEFEDDCAGLAQVILPSTIENIINKTADSYTIIRDWIVSDVCGNTQVYTQTVNVKVKDGLSIQEYEACNADAAEINLQELIPEEYKGLGKWKDPDNSGGLLSDLDGTFSAFKIPLGRYLLEYVIDDASCPRVNQVSVNVTDDCAVLGCGEIIIHDFFSPNEDGYNDFFKIENITDPCYQSNSVKIFNRWGALVYQTDGYDNNVKVFRGISEANVTVNQNAELPSGTYYYLLEYTLEDKPYKKGGYLYLSR